MRTRTELVSACQAVFEGEVRVARHSLDATLALLDATAPRLILAISPAPPLVAALGAALRGSRLVRAIAGSADDLDEVIPAALARLGPGRLLLARDWRLDPDAALYGRRGLALASAPADDRPRTLAESPLPVSARVRQALETTVESADLRRYPAMLPARLEAALAAREGVPPAQVLVSGGGSLELLHRALRAFTDPGDEVAARSPTFDAVEDACAREGLVLRFADDLTEAAGRARLVYLASPNAPDCKRISPLELDAIRRALGGDRVLLLDEAYAGFDATPGPVDLLRLCDPPRAPVLVLRTFSKLEGLAGLRVGYALGPPALVNTLRRHSLPYALTPFQEAAALAAVADEPHRARTRALVTEGRARLTDGLRALGFAVADSTTHLLLVTPPEARLEQVRALVVRESLPMEELPRLPGSFQLSVLEPDAARELLEKLRDA
jgi:histidinol-phosphate aminotransferase